MKHWFHSFSTAFVGLTIIKLSIRLLKKSLPQLFTDISHTATWQQENNMEASSSTLQSEKYKMWFLQ